MIKRVKWWMYLAVLFGGSLFQLGGCGLGENARVLWYILREDLFS